MQILTYRLLVVLGRGEADGAQLLDRLPELGAGERPSVPTLYRALREAVELGWVESDVADDAAGRGRPPRTYRLTETGLGAAREEAERLRDLAALGLDRRLASEPGAGGGR